MDGQWCVITGRRNRSIGRLIIVRVSIPKSRRPPPTVEPTHSVTTSEITPVLRLELSSNRVRLPPYDKNQSRTVGYGNDKTAQNVYSDDRSAEERYLDATRRTRFVANELIRAFTAVPPCYTARRYGGRCRTTARRQRSRKIIIRLRSRDMGKPSAISARRRSNGSNQTRGGTSSAHVVSASAAPGSDPEGLMARDSRGSTRCKQTCKVAR